MHVPNVYFHRRILKHFLIFFVPQPSPPFFNTNANTSYLTNTEHANEAEVEVRQIYIFEYLSVTLRACCHSRFGHS